MVMAAGAGEELVPVKPNAPGNKTSDRLIIFDWDDTLLPTSWLERQRMHPTSAPRHVSAQLRAHEALCNHTIDLALGLGTVIMVTNAAPGWVEASSQEFMPSVAAKLRSLGMPIHAKPMHTSMHFKLDIMRREAKGYSRVVSLGDGPVERLACLRCAEADVRLSVKFREMPTLIQLGQQHELMHQRFADIAQNNHDLDLRFQFVVKPGFGTKPVVTLAHVSRPGQALGGGLSSPSRTAPFTQGGNPRAAQTMTSTLDWPPVNATGQQMARTGDDFRRGRSTSPPGARSVPLPGTARRGPDEYEEVQFHQQPLAHQRPSSDAGRRTHSEGSPRGPGGLPRIEGAGSPRMQKKGPAPMVAKKRTGSPAGTLSARPTNGSRGMTDRGL